MLYSSDTVKTLIALIFSSIVLFSVYAEDEQEGEGDVEKLKKLLTELKEHDESVSDIVPKIQGLQESFAQNKSNRSIYNQIESIKRGYKNKTQKLLFDVFDTLDTYQPPLRNHPWPGYAPVTQEYWNRSNEIADIIEPYILNLTSISNNDVFHSDHTTAFHILDYARPSDDLRDSLLSYINKDKKYAPMTNAYAYRALYKLGLENEEITEELATEILTKIKSGRISDSLQIMSTLSKWHVIPEFIPAYVERIKQVPDESRLESRKLQLYSILRQIRDWGDAAKPLLPYLEEQMLLLEKAYEEAGLTLNRRPYLDGVGLINAGSDELNISSGYSYIVDAKRRGELPSEFDLNISLEEKQSSHHRNVKQKGVVANDKTLFSEETKSNSFPWWLIGIVGLVVVLGVMLLKGKSS